MRFITEQELIVQNRQQPLQKFTVAQDQRLTPEASQFLTDHHVDVIRTGSNGITNSKKNVEKPKLSPTTKANYYKLLRIELQDAALKANEVDLDVSKEIFSMADETSQIAAGEEIESSDSKEDDQVESVEVSNDQLLTPQGKILLKLQRSLTYACLLKEKVSKEEQEKLNYLITRITNEIRLLIGEE